MATKKSVKKTTNTAQHLDSIEGLLRSGFRQVDQRFEQVDKRFEQVDQRLAQVDKRLAQVDQRLDQVDQRLAQVDRRLDQADRRQDVFEFDLADLKRQLSEQGAMLEQKIDRLTEHVDGFMKLHETLDIEFKVLKEQMSRMEARLDRLEASRSP